MAIPQMQVGSPPRPESPRTFGDPELANDIRKVIIAAVVSGLIALGAHSAYSIYSNWRGEKALQAKRTYEYDRWTLISRRQIDFLKAEGAILQRSQGRDEALLNGVEQIGTRSESRRKMLRVTADNISSINEDIGALSAFSVSTTGMSESYFAVMRACLDSELATHTLFRREMEHPTRPITKVAEHLSDQVAQRAGAVHALRSAQDEYTARRKLDDLEFKTRVNEINKSIDDAFIGMFLGLVGVALAAFGTFTLISHVFPNKGVENLERLVETSASNSQKT